MRRDSGVGSGGDEGVAKRAVPTKKIKGFFTDVQHKNTTKFEKFFALVSILRKITAFSSVDFTIREKLM